METKRTNTQVRLKPYIRALIWLVPAAIAINKFMLRPWVYEHSHSNLLLILVNSLPNFIEAIIGTALLTGIGLTVKARSTGKVAGASNRTIYALATLLCGIYVLTQEFNLHSLGGNNVYDPFDAGASLLGMAFMYLLLSRYGFREP